LALHLKDIGFHTHERHMQRLCQKLTNGLKNAINLDKLKDKLTRITPLIHKDEIHKIIQIQGHCH